MIDRQSVLYFGTDVHLEQWDEKGVLFHPASQSTLLIDPILYSALITIKNGPIALSDIVNGVSESNPIATDACEEHLIDGFTRLYNDGIVSIR